MADYDELIVLSPPNHEGQEHDYSTVSKSVSTVEIVDDKVYFILNDGETGEVYKYDKLDEPLISHEGYISRFHPISDTHYLLSGNRLTAKDEKGYLLFSLQGIDVFISSLAFWWLMPFFHMFNKTGL